MSFPIIDISMIDEPSFQPSIAKEVTEACKKWGFLILKEHPIPPGEIEEMFALGRKFFYLPDEEKDPWPINSQRLGYVGPMKNVKKNDNASMWFGGAPGQLPNNEALPPFWRQYADKIESFKQKCHDLVLKLLFYFAIGMDLPETDFFAKAHSADGGNESSLRMLMYPARSTQLPATRMPAHTDSGSVTLLFQQKPGLEILSPSGEWMKTPHIENSILVNLGDALSFWSGRQLKATMHRVSYEGLPYDQERQSMAYFGTANPETVLKPLVQGISGENYVSNQIQLWDGITVGELSKRIMEGIYGL